MIETDLGIIYFRDAIQNDFPRIIDLPNGVGMNSYTIAISACKEYLVDINDTLKGLL